MAYIGAWAHPLPSSIITVQHRVVVAVVVVITLITAVIIVVVP